MKNKVNFKDVIVFVLIAILFVKVFQSKAIEIYNDDELRDRVFDLETHQNNFRLLLERVDIRTDQFEHMVDAIDAQQSTQFDVLVFMFREEIDAAIVQANFNSIDGDFFPNIPRAELIKFIRPMQCYSTIGSSLSSDLDYRVGYTYNDTMYRIQDYEFSMTYSAYQILMHDGTPCWVTFSARQD